MMGSLYPHDGGTSKRKLGSKKDHYPLILTIHLKKKKKRKKKMIIIQQSPDGKGTSTQR